MKKWVTKVELRSKLNRCLCFPSDDWPDVWLTDTHNSIRYAMHSVIIHVLLLPMDAVMGKVHTVANEQEKTALIRPDMIQKAIEVEAKRSAEERRKQFEREFSGMSLLDIFSSGQISRTRREVIRELIRELIQAGAEDETIKSIIRPELTEAEVQEKKKAWMEMQNI